MKEASGCPPESGRQQGGFQKQLPPTAATAYLAPPLSSAAIASGQGTLFSGYWSLVLSRHLLCAYGDSRSALPVVLAEVSLAHCRACLQPPRKTVWAWKKKAISPRNWGFLNTPFFLNTPIPNPKRSTETQRGSVS